MEQSDNVAAVSPHGQAGDGVDVINTGARSKHWMLVDAWRQHGSRDDLERSASGSVVSGMSRASSMSAKIRRAKLAALEQERIFMQKEENLENLRLANEQAAKRLQLERAMAVTKAELEVLEQDTDDELDVTGKSSIRNPSRSPSPNGKTADAASQHTSHQSVRSSSQQSLATPEWPHQLEQAMKLSQMPKLELTTFRGDPLEFQQWLIAFERLIEEMTDDPARRLHYLMQFTVGEANTLVTGYLLNQSAEGYKQAKTELMNEFGNPHVLARAYIRKVEGWPTIKGNDAAALRSYVVFLKKCRGSMPTLKHLQQLNTDCYLQRLVSKLPSWMQQGWRKAVCNIEEKGDDVTFENFVTFVDKQCHIMKHPVFSSEALNEAEGKRPPDADKYQNRFSKNPTATVRPRAVLATNVNTAAADTGLASSCSSLSCIPAGTCCPSCRRVHDLDDCREYQAKSVDERRRFLIEKQLCFACYATASKSHNARTCKQRRVCKICGKSHPTGLHGYKPMPKLTQNSSEHHRTLNNEHSTANNDETAVKAVGAFATDVSDSNITMSIVKVLLTTDAGNKVTVYAALDSLSSACFIQRDIWTLLGSPGQPTEITVRTLSDERKLDTFAVNGLRVSPVDGKASLLLPKTFTQEELPINVHEIPSHDALKQWPHLTRLLSKMPDRDETIPVGLLIGANCPKALEPLDVIPSQLGGPFAMRTVLGWCVSGPIRSTHHDRLTNNTVVCSRIAVFEPKVQVVESQVKRMIRNMYESDFNESTSHTLHHLPSSTAMSSEPDGVKSHEDQLFLDMMEEKVQFVDGHYQLPLPFRNANVALPNNRGQALQRAAGIKRRMARDVKFRADYTSFMNDIITKGHARKVSATSENAEADRQGRCWYLPHHGVYHPKKPNKIRVVFDCSCQYKGQSLNSELLQGPNLTNSIVGVLTRFRKESFAFMADIEAMFYQVRVPENQMNYLRFVWWPDGNIEAEPEDYQMCVHLFGGISSPSCSNFALRMTAEDNEKQFGPEAANTLRRNFYVDDLLGSSKDGRSAARLISSVQAMCAAGGFRLTKFVANDKTVLEPIDEKDRAKLVTNLELTQSTPSVERVLGVCWCVENDAFGFRINVQDQPLTRRGILSTISSIYDPLGFAAPFLLSGRLLLQCICNSKRGWDEPITGEERVLWEQWRRKLLYLEKIEVARCFRPPGFGNIISTTLHSFSDASTEGYGQCSYLRLVNDKGDIHCCLVMGKSRVPPLKPVTIPRLELIAATVAAKVGHMLSTEIDINDCQQIYWTDSRIVLGYINNDVKRFHMFVANRVQLIRDYTDHKSWRYIDSRSNPADDASRGLDESALVVHHRWFRGPDFLWTDDKTWPSPIDSCKLELVVDDPEIRKPAKTVYATSVLQEQPDLVYRLETTVSAWYQLTRLIAIWQKFFLYLKQRKIFSPPITVEDLQHAERLIIKSVQSRSFASEIGSLQNLKPVKSVSSVFRLDPFLDQDGLLRVGGRLRRSDLDEECKHPVILPKASVVTTLIVRFCHEQVKHSGRQLTLNEIRRRGYWMITGNSVVRRVIYRCVRCRLLRRTTCQPKMSDLPVDRVAATPPFTYCAVDLFGPFLIKQGRSDVKRYGCIFTCLACRAIHIETTNSLDTDSFINALRRFIARRGNIRQLRSDNGTNFVGAEMELRRALQEMDHNKIAAFLLQNGGDYIIWKRNPPTASNMGGVWERQIRSVRAILASLLRDHGSMLDDELFRTLLAEAEAVVNSRPLTVETLSDATSPCPLSPIQLLTMKSSVIAPLPGLFPSTDVYCRRRWRRVQHLANEFWSRWKKEYLASLQPREKNVTKERNFQVGDIVLLKEDDISRNDWSMAKITEVHWDDIHDCVRSVKLLMATNDLAAERTYKERPANKLILLLESELHQDTDK